MTSLEAKPHPLPTREGPVPAPPLDQPAETLTLVEIAQRLERVASLIEAERAREREARARYQEVADQTDQRIRTIKEQAAALVREQQRRLRSFDGMLDDQDAQVPRTLPPSAPRRHSPLATPPNIGQAILRLWTLPEFDHPLTTDEIAEALPAVGYDSRAVPRSLRSAVNQALAKLCRDGQIDKYRQDGTIISHTDRRSRARKYMPRA